MEVGAEPVRALARGLRHLRAAAADGEAFDVALLEVRDQARHPQRDVGALVESFRAVHLRGGAIPPRRFDERRAIRSLDHRARHQRVRRRRSAAARRSRGPGDRRCGPTPVASPSARRRTPPRSQPSRSRSRPPAGSCAAASRRRARATSRATSSASSAAGWFIRSGSAGRGSRRRGRPAGSWSGAAPRTAPRCPSPGSSRG